MVRTLLLWIAVVVGIGLVSAPAPALAQGPTWTGEYYNNSFLQGDVTLTRSDAAISFNWGGGSPASNINSDGFSARWTALAGFSAGTYRFWVLADDNIRITLNDAYTPILDTFGQNKMGQIVSVDVTMPAGTSKIRVDYQEVSGNAFAYVTWANLASNPSGPNFPAQPSVITTPVNAGTWTAEYFANASLFGTPSLIQSEASVSKNWGSTSPVVSIPGDNFSARWTSVQTLEAGSYSLVVRADDGVKVFVDGALAINEWHGATGATYTANLNLSAGAHTFVVEYYEAAGDAFIDYTLTRVIASVSPPAGQGGGATGTTVTVTSARLNVRAAPDVSGAILVKISANETYAVTGKNANASWYQINVNGVVGWVSARFVRLNGSTDVPVISTSTGLAQPVDTGYITTALATVNVRNAPNVRSGAILVKMQRGETARVIGRTSDNRWWMVNFNGTTGWVSSTYAQLQPTAELARIPVTA